MHFFKLGLLPLLAALPGARAAACGSAGGIPRATGIITSKSYILVNSGQVFDGKLKRYDRGAGACHGQAEGSEY
ncbi:hypothetical protein CTA2_8004 [Colletotrichum tanaceti]|nr:hypothetical protein CTA2_8004 [Colletotrichum tanaceti]